jgi:hypothetical protein
MLHAFDDLAPDGILAVEEAAIVEADEELAVGAVRVLRAGHGGDAALVRLAAEFGRKVGLVGSPHAASRRIAALGHEAVDDAVEDDAVVETLLGQLLDAGDMARREIGAQPDDDVAAAVEGKDEGVLVVGHVGTPGLVLRRLRPGAAHIPERFSNIDRGRGRA